jgi:hypothetical protein
MQSLALLSSGYPERSIAAQPCYRTERSVTAARRPNVC